MGNNRMASFLVGVLALAVLAPFAMLPIDETPDIGCDAETQEEPMVPPADLSYMLSGLDGYFIENRGQVANPEVLFYAHGDPLSIGLTRDGMIFTHTAKKERGSQMQIEPVPRTGSSFRTRFNGCNPSDPVGLFPRTHRCNYFFGDDPDAWLSDIDTFDEVYYASLYDGIDLRFYFSQGMFKYDFIVKPGFDSSDIVMEYEGVHGLSVDPGTGDLMIHIANGILRDKAPVILDPSSRNCDGVEGEYVLLDGTSIAYRIPDTIREGSGYIIDPGLLYSTLMGGHDDEDWAYDVDLDDDGNVYIVGFSLSLAFPVSPGAYCQTLQGDDDMILAKFDPTLSNVIFSTYFGAKERSIEYERPLNMEVVPGDGIIIMGYLDSATFPTTPNALFPDPLGGNRDGFISKFSLDGSSLLYSSYLGGSGFEQMAELAVDASGHVFAAGLTASSDIPTTTGAFCETREEGRMDYDLFIMKFTSSLETLLSCTYIGGSGHDLKPTIAFAPDGTLYIGATTRSQDFPMINDTYSHNHAGGTQDCAILHMDANLETLFASTYIGSTGYDGFQDLAICEGGDVVLTMITYGTDFPLTPDAFDSVNTGGTEATLTVLDKGLTDITFSTLIGGSSYESAFDLFLSPDDQIVYLGGYTTSSDLDVTKGAYDRYKNPGNDLFFASVNLTTNSLVYLSYFGGSFIDLIEIEGMAQKSDSVFAVAGRSSSQDFPTTSNAYQVNQSNQTLGVDAMVFIIDLQPVPTLPAPVLTALPGDGSVNLSWDLDVEWCQFEECNVYRGESRDEITHWVGSTWEDWLVDDTAVNGRTYYYQVAVNNSAGEGERSNVVEALPLGFPSAPVLEGWSGDGCNHLNWTPPASDGGRPVVGYVLLVSNSSNESLFLPLVELGNVTGWVHAGIVLGQVYNYRVLAINERNQGEPSNVLTLVATDIPSVPLEFNVTAKAGLVELEWDVPMSDGGSSLLGYMIFRGESEDEMKLIGYNPPNVLGYVDRNVVNGTLCHYQVQAFSVLGNGVPTEIVDAMPFGPPSEPVEPTTHSGDGEVRLTWERPSSDGGSDITSYNVYAGPNEGSMSLIGSSQIQEYIHSGLTNSVTWYYSIGASNGHGEGPHSDVVPGTPFGLSTEPQEFQALGGVQEVVLTWADPEDTGGAALVLFRVYRAVGTADPEPIAEVGPSDHSYKDKGVEPGILCTYTVAAETIAGEGAMSQSEQAMAYGPPGKPVNLMAQLTAEGIGLTWDPPLQDGGRDIASYVVKRGTSMDDLSRISEGSSDQDYTDMDIEHGVAYVYVVSAVNEAGAGEPAMVKKMSIRSPSEPQDFSVKLVKGVVETSWSHPATDGGLPITGYLLLRGFDEASVSIYKELGLATSYTDEDVEDGEEYFYSLRAINAVDAGMPTTPVPIKVPTEPEADGVSTWAIVVVIVLLVIVIGGGTIIAIRRRSFGETEGPPGGARMDTHEEPDEDRHAKEGEVEDDD